MPTTEPDQSFTDTIKRFITDGCGGSKAKAAKKLGIARQHVGNYWAGAVPLEKRKQECLDVMARAGYHPGTGHDGETGNVTLVTKSVTGSANPVAIANMLRFLLDLVENNGLPPQGRENEG